MGPCTGQQLEWDGKSGHGRAMLDTRGGRSGPE